MTEVIISPGYESLILNIRNCYVMIDTDLASLYETDTKVLKQRVKRNREGFPSDFIRNEKVMLDRDLAVLFDVKAIRLREQLKRNIEKFPSHFMFQLTNEEVDTMVSQNAIPSRKHLGGSLPYVFTEYGVLQLANVLRSDRATQVSIKIIEVFVRMRKMLSDTLKLQIDIETIKKKLENQGKNIELIFDYLNQLIEKQEKSEPRKQIGFKQSGN